MFLKILKYAPFSFILIENVSINENQNWIFIGFKDYASSKHLYFLLFVLACLLAFVCLDLYLKFFEDPTKKFDRVYGEKKNFVSRLSTLERKRWIV